MLNHVREVATALVLSAALYGVGNCQPLPQWGISEIYSNADGSVQFIVVEITRDGPSLAGQTLIASNGSTQKRYTFPTDVPYDISSSELRDLPTSTFSSNPILFCPMGFCLQRKGRSDSASHLARADSITQPFRQTASTRYVTMGHSAAARSLVAWHPWPTTGERRALLCWRQAPSR